MWPPCNIEDSFFFYEMAACYHKNITGSTKCILMGFLEVQGATQSQWAFMNTMQKEVFHYPCPQAPLLGPALEAPLPAMNGLGEEQGLQ